MKKRMLFPLFLLSFSLLLPTAAAPSEQLFPWSEPLEATPSPSPAPEVEETPALPKPASQGAINLERWRYFVGGLNDVENEYWTVKGSSYSSSVLTLKNGLYIESNGDCVTPPDNCTVVVEGTVVLESREGRGMNLSKKQTLTFTPGATLIIRSKDSALELRYPLVAENCTLDLTSIEHSAINTQNYVYFGATSTVTIRSKAGYCVNSAADVSILGNATLVGESGGVSAASHIQTDPRSQISITCTDPNAVGMKGGNQINLSGKLDVTSGGDGIIAGGSLSATGSTNIKAGGNGLSVQEALTVSNTDLTVEAGARGLLLEGGLNLNNAKLIVTEGQPGDGLTLQGDVTLGRCQLDLPSTFSTTGNLTMTDSKLAATGISAGRDIALTGSELRVDSAPLGNGLYAGGSIKLDSGSKAEIQSAKSNGVYAVGAFSMSDSTLSVTDTKADGLKADGDILLDTGSSVALKGCQRAGIWSEGMITIHGTATIDSTLEGIGTPGSVQLMDGSAVNVKSTGAVGISGQRGVTSAGNCSLIVDAATDGVSSQGDISLNFENDKKHEITAKRHGIQSSSKITLCQPGHLSIDAGDIGIRAESDVTVGRDAETLSSLTLKSVSYSIASAHGNVALRATDGIYNFDGSIWVDTKAGKTYSVLEGAALLIGAREGFGVAIFRKDYTFTPDMTPTRLDIRLMQIGAEHTVRVTSGTQMKVGPLILGKNAQLILEDGSDTYYNGPTNQVLGEVKRSTTQRMDFVGTPRDYGSYARWDAATKTLTLTDAVVDVDSGPALSLPGGSTLVLKGGTNSLSSSGGAGPVVDCAGDLTIEGGKLELRGGDSGIKAAGNLTVNNSNVVSSGSPAVNLADGSTLRGQGAALSNSSAAAPVVQADGSANVSGDFAMTGGSAGIRTGGTLTLSGTVGTDGAPAVALAPGGRLSSGGAQLSISGGEAAVLAEGDGTLTGKLTLSGGGVKGDAGTLSLENAEISADRGPAVMMADGGTLLALPEAQLTVTGAGPVIRGEGALALTGGSVTLTGGETGIEAVGVLSAADTALTVTGASGPALKAESLTSSRSALELIGNGSPLLVSDSVTIDSLPGDIQALASADGVILKKDGTPLQDLAVSGDGKSDQQFKTNTRQNEDGTTTSIVTNLTTGAVTETTALPDGSTKVVTADKGAGTTTEKTIAPDGTRTETLTDRDGGVTTTETSPDGTYVLNQTRPDGTTLFAQLDKEGEGGLMVTLPDGVENARVTLPLPAGAQDLVPFLYAPDGTETPIPLSDTMDGSLVLLAPADSAIRLVPTSASFGDVDASAWYADDVAFISGRGLMQGVGDGRFAPLEPITCSMLLTALHRMAGAPQAPYTEGALLLEGAAGDEWYYDALLWGVAEGVVDGVVDGFLPEAQATREQIASMLFRTAPILGLDDTQRDSLNAFNDTAEAGEWALPALKWTVSQDVLRGRGWGILDPGTTATRSEEAALLRRFVHLALAP